MSKAKRTYLGPKPKYTSPDEITGLIDQYFKDCEGTPLIDDNGQAVLDKWGRLVIVGAHPPTVTGLALALGFTSRQALLNYQYRKEFQEVITLAKSRVEEYTERRLFDKEGFNGARFSLVNNYQGWRDRPQTDLDKREQELRIKVAEEKAGAGERDTSLFESIVKAAQGDKADDGDKVE
ncbi:terminase small subunit [Holdemania filiformis]|jgi:hypothetical protein|uniref:terminase small subunit n=1 Tax=Holdemania filiformis TaxID=61171 RepID=UPI00243227C6|nr:terminase small subunit [Holdemania filiformis]MBS5001091.1 hypothetical protein [Holdemania filiformis]